MQILVDPDFCGWPDPSSPGKRWWLTEEQWYLFTRVLMREMARYGYDDHSGDPWGGENFKNTWDSRSSDAAMIVKVFRNDPCHVIADVPWGTRLDWRQYACFAAGIASNLKKQPATLAAIAYLMPRILQYQATADPAMCIDLNGAVAALAGPGGVCDPAVYNDLTYFSGVEIPNALMTFDGDYDPNHIQTINSYVDKAFYAAGGKDEHIDPSGYPTSNSSKVAAGTPAPPSPGYKPKQGDFQGYASPSGKQWAPSSAQQASGGTSWGPIVAAGVIGLVGVGILAATLMFAGKKPNENPPPPYVPLTPERKRLVRSIDARNVDLRRGIKLVGVTFRGERLEAKRKSHEHYSVKVGSREYTYPYSQDAAAHFVALDATRLAA